MFLHPKLSLRIPVKLCSGVLKSTSLPPWKPEVVTSVSTAYEPVDMAEYPPDFRKELDAAVYGRQAPPTYSGPSHPLSPQLPTTETEKSALSEASGDITITRPLTREPLIGTPVRLSLRRPDMVATKKKIAQHHGRSEPVPASGPYHVELPVPPVYAPLARGPEADVTAPLESASDRFIPPSFRELPPVAPTREYTPDMAYTPLPPLQGSRQTADKTETSHVPETWRPIPLGEHGAAPPHDTVQRREPERQEAVIFHFPVASPARKQEMARQEELFLDNVESGTYVYRQPMPELPLAPRIQRARTPAAQVTQETQTRQEATETPGQDIDAIARDVYAILKRRLVRERERALGF